MQMLKQGFCSLTWALSTKLVRMLAQLVKLGLNSLACMILTLNGQKKPLKNYHLHLSIQRTVQLIQCRR